MSTFGRGMITAAEKALAYAAGETAEGFVAYHPVVVRALRARLGLAQPEFAARYGLSVGGPGLGAGTQRA